MEYRKGDICSFLLRFQVEKGSEFTHTSIVKPAGSFYIPSEKLDEFYLKYALAVKHNDDLYVTERHRDISPLLVDLDFRFTKTEKLERKFTNEDINAIVQLYIDTIKLYVEVPEKWNVYIMQKPYPVIDKNVVKDGVHIIFPDIVTKPSVQYLIRKAILKDIGKILDKLELVNGYEDVVDEAVIQRNNWLMYGSRKPNCEKYDIIRILSVTGETVEMIDQSVEENYVEILSIRNKYDALKIKIEKETEISLFEAETKRKKNKMDTGVLQTNQNTKKNICDNIEYIKKLVDILSTARSERYTDWIRVGWCLRNIDHRLLDKWIDFSKKSPKFIDGECEKIWNYMKEDGLGIGTLHMWAKQDNIDLYKELIKKDLSNLIFRSKNETHHDIANVVHFMYKHDFVCVSIKQNYWYEFKDHRWIPCDSGHALRAKISTEVFKEYMNHAAFWNQKGSADEDEGEQQRCGEIAKKLTSIALKLKQTAFKDNIMKECKELFYASKFEEKLDSRANLIGFENGVYDLESMEFREGRPEDYISFTTSINYIPYNPVCVQARIVEDSLNKIFTKPHLKEYVLLLLSSFLNGNIKEERFHIWTGSGCHKKDTNIMMADKTIKKVQDIEIGDQLMGDDFTSRNVLKLCRGFADMYEIYPTSFGGGKPFIVNGDHILSLKSLDNKIVDISVTKYLENISDYKNNLFLYRANSNAFINFIVKKNIPDNFYGFELDGNHRYLLDDYTVTHNSNGKSISVDLFEKCFGEYCCKLPITLLTQKRAASNAATSELARTKGKRFACLQEPSEDEKLNVGLMKELTGGDKIMARLLYKEPIEFKPQFKMILTCNTLPNVPSDDGGTWRRIRVVEFTSRFCENPDSTKENEFLMDTELSGKLENCKEYFMSLLIEYYKKYIENGITEPDEVLQCTKEYQKNNDTFLEFVEQECDRDEEEFLSYTEVYSAFRMWCKENNMQMICSKKREFIKAVSKLLGRCITVNKLEGWKGWRFKKENDEDDL